MVDVTTSGVRDLETYTVGGLSRGVRSLIYPKDSISILAFSSKVKPNFEFKGGGLGIGRAGREFLRSPRNPCAFRLISLIFLLLRVLEAAEARSCPNVLFLEVKGGLKNATNSFFVLLYFTGKAEGFLLTSYSNHLLVLGDFSETRLI